VLNYSCKKNEDEIKIGYNPSCEEARLVRALVTSKTGQRQEIATNEINIMDAGWNASAKRYTGGKILVANLPGVDIGSTIEVEYRIAIRGKPYLSGFEPFHAFDDLDKKDVRLMAPPGLRVQTILTGPSGIVKQEIKTNEDTQLFQWAADHVKALPAEGQLPPEWVYMAGVDYFVGDMDAYLKDLELALHEK